MLDSVGSCMETDATTSYNCNPSQGEITSPNVANRLREKKKLVQLEG